MSLPLYDYLCARYTQRGGLSPSMNINLIRESLGQLPPEICEHLLCLVIHYYYLTNTNLSIFTPENCDPKVKKPILPYGMKISPGGKGLSLLWESLPDGLQVIFVEYFTPENL